MSIRTAAVVICEKRKTYRSIARVQNLSLVDQLSIFGGESIKEQTLR